MQTYAYREKKKPHPNNVYIVKDITLAITTQERHLAITVDSAVST